MDLEIEKEAVFPPSVHYHFQQFYHSCLLQAKITTLAIQTETGERPNIRGGHSVMNRIQITSPIHQPTILNLLRTQRTLELGK
jgi:hypothetical protein